MLVQVIKYRVVEPKNSLNTLYTLKYLSSSKYEFHCKCNAEV